MCFERLFKYARASYLHNKVYTVLLYTACILSKGVNVNICIVSYHYFTAVDTMHTYNDKCLLNWWKGKPSGSIACTRKQQPRFYWSCSSVVMNDATPLTPLAHKQNSIFKCKQYTCTLHDPWGPENMTTQWCSTGRLFTAATPRGKRTVIQYTHIGVIIIYTV